MTSAVEIFPFDGECARSRDADFTLTFDDKSYLKISQSLLQLASPVLKAAIGDCQHNNTLHLLETSNRTWILILNYIHPAGRSVSLADAIVEAGYESTADVLKQCEKFGFVSLKEDMDGRLAKAVDAMHPALQRLTGNLKTRYVFADPEMPVIRALKEYELPKSEDAVVAHLIALAQDSINQSTQDTAAGRRRDTYNADTAKQRIVCILNEMHKAGRYKLCSKFMQEAIKKTPFLADV